MCKIILASCIKKSAVPLLAILLVAISQNSSCLDDEKNNLNQTESLDEMSSGIRQNQSIIVEPLLIFSSNLFKKLDGNKKNIIVSPVSIHSALNLLLLGADPNSKTESELRNVLGYSKLSNSTVLRAHESYAKLIDEFKAVSALGIGEAKIDKEKVASGEKDYERGRDERHPILEIWNTAVTKGTSKILPEYSDLVKKYYRSSVEDVTEPKNRDQLYEKVNKWAKEAGFDNEVLSRAQLDDQFQLLLMSAVRVEAAWFEEFFESEVEDLFYNHGLTDKLIKKATGLFQSDFRGGFVEFTQASKAQFPKRYQIVQKVHPGPVHDLSGLDFRAIQVSLKGGLTFDIIEPLTNGTGKELDKLKEQLLTINDKETKLEKVFQVLDCRRVRAEIESLRIPKFKFESDLGLKDPLKSIGLQRVFEEGKAELTKMTKDKLMVDDAKHQAVIEVHKHGIKAAGITTVKLVPLSAKIADEPIIINVSNPFMFVVRYKQLPLFIGQLDHL